jgi:hypothetical protein
VRTKEKEKIKIKMEGVNNKWDGWRQYIYTRAALRNKFRKREMLCNSGYIFF